MKLAILIPTIDGRERSFNRLKFFLEYQIAENNFQDRVIIQFIKDNGELSIGEKRNKLYEISKGEYSVQIDDDDWVHQEFIKKILDAVETSPDVIGWKELCIFNNTFIKSVSTSIRNQRWAEMVNGFGYIRTPYNKSVIRTDLCRQVKFKDVRFAEDHIFSREIYHMLKKEIFIDDFMYYYYSNYGKQY